MLVTLGASGKLTDERVVVDPIALDPTGATTIDFYRPSYDGRLVLVSLSKNGSEDGTAYIFDTRTGRQLPDIIVGVNYPTAGGSAEWSPDGSGFYYTRYPQGNERQPDDKHFYQQIYYHRLGTAVANDTYILGKDFPRIAEVALTGSRDGRFLLAEVRNGDGGEIAYFVRGEGEQWSRFANFTDGVKQVTFGDDGNLYAMSDQSSGCSGRSSPVRPRRRRWRTRASSSRRTRSLRSVC